MLYNYTVTLQSKQDHKKGMVRPRKFKTTAKDLNEVFARLDNTAMSPHYIVKSIMRSPFAPKGVNK